MTTTSATIARDTITRAQLRLICAAAAGHLCNTVVERIGDLGNLGLHDLR